MKIFKVIGGFFLKWNRCSEITQNVIFHIKCYSLILTLSDIREVEGEGEVSFITFERDTKFWNFKTKFWLTKFQFRKKSSMMKFAIQPRNKGTKRFQVEGTAENLLKNIVFEVSD